MTLIPIPYEQRGHAKKVEQELKAAMAWIDMRFTLNFKATTRMWKTQVAFRTNMMTPYHLAHGTNNKIYAIVTRGAPPHVITPKKAGMLVFQSGYKAKTVPGELVSGPGGSFGPIVRAKSVNHPGHQARDFDKNVVLTLQGPFVRRVQEAITRALS